MRSILMKLADKAADRTDDFMTFLDVWSRRLAWAAIILALIYIILPAVWTIATTTDPPDRERMFTGEPEIQKAMREAVRR